MDISTTPDRNVDEKMALSDAAAEQTFRLSGAVHENVTDATHERIRTRLLDHQGDHVDACIGYQAPHHGRREPRRPGCFRADRLWRSNWLQPVCNPAEWYLLFRLVWQRGDRREHDLLAGHRSKSRHRLPEFRLRGWRRIQCDNRGRWNRCGVFRRARADAHYEQYPCRILYLSPANRIRAARRRGQSGKFYHQFQ